MKKIIKNFKLKSFLKFKYFNKFRYEYNLDINNYLESINFENVKYGTYLYMSLKFDDGYKISSFEIGYRYKNNISSKLDNKIYLFIYKFFRRNIIDLNYSTYFYTNNSIVEKNMKLMPILNTFDFPFLFLMKECEEFPSIIDKIKLLNIYCFDLKTDCRKYWGYFNTYILYFL